MVRPARLSHLTLHVALVLTLLVGGVGAAVAGAGTGTALGGASLTNVDQMRASGLDPDLGAFWVEAGSKDAWHEVESNLRSAREKGVTPVVHWYYWGDDISPECVENGCWSDLHGAHKSRGDWYAMAERLAQTIHREMDGREAIVVLETEFNKQGIPSWEPFDGHLAAQAGIFREHAPDAKLVLGFGSWGQGTRGNFDRAADAVDWIGFQTLSGVTRDTEDQMRGTVEHLVQSNRELAHEFGKPTFLAHWAFSTYGVGEEMQRVEVAEFFDRLPEMQRDGLVGFTYRHMVDHPGFDTRNHYGEAERHWGLIRADGSGKPALEEWRSGMATLQAEEPAPAPWREPTPGEAAPAREPRPLPDHADARGGGSPFLTAVITAGVVGVLFLRHVRLPDGPPGPVLADAAAEAAWWAARGRDGVRAFRHDAVRAFRSRAGSARARREER